MNHARVLFSEFSSSFTQALLTTLTFSYICFLLWVRSSIGVTHAIMRTASLEILWYLHATLRTLFHCMAAIWFLYFWNLSASAYISVPYRSTECTYIVINQCLHDLGPSVLALSLAKSAKTLATLSAASLMCSQKGSLVFNITPSADSFVCTSLSPIHKKWVRLVGTRFFDEHHYPCFGICQLESVLFHPLVYSSHYLIQIYQFYFSITLYDDWCNYIILM